MARINPSANLMDDKRSENSIALDYTVKGASLSIISTIDEFAARADKVLEGGTVVKLEPAVIDVSFLRDRMQDDPEAFEALICSVREHRQG